MRYAIRYRAAFLNIQIISLPSHSSLTLEHRIVVDGGGFGEVIGFLFFFAYPPTDALRTTLMPDFSLYDDVFNPSLYC